MGMSPAFANLHSVSLTSSSLVLEERCHRLSAPNAPCEAVISALCACGSWWMLMLAHALHFVRQTGIVCEPCVRHLLALLLSLGVAHIESFASHRECRLTRQLTHSCNHPYPPQWHRTYSWVHNSILLRFIASQTVHAIEEMDATQPIIWHTQDSEAIDLGNLIVRLHYLKSNRISCAESLWNASPLLCEAVLPTACLESILWAVSSEECNVYTICITLCKWLSFDYQKNHETIKIMIYIHELVTGFEPAAWWSTPPPKI